MKSTIFIIAVILSFQFITMAQTVPILNKEFPRLEGESLSGKKVVFPDSVKGKVVILIAAFERDTQKKIDSWAKPILEKYDESGGEVQYYEVPMIGGWFAKMMSGVIDAGMRGGVPKKLHNYVVTYYGDLDDYLQQFGVDDKSNCYLFVLDKNGVVRYTEKGAADNQKLKELYQEIDKLK